MPTRAHTLGVPAKVQIRKVIIIKSKVSGVLLVSHSLFTATAISSGAKRGKTNKEPGVRRPGGRGGVLRTNLTSALTLSWPSPGFSRSWVCLPLPTSRPS